MAKAAFWTETDTEARKRVNMSTYNLARMNMFLHDVAAENQNLHHGDTLDADWPTG